MRLARSFPDHTISREALESRYEKAIKGDDFGQRYYIIEEKSSRKPIGWTSLDIHGWTRRATGVGSGEDGPNPAGYPERYGTEGMHLGFREASRAPQLIRIMCWMCDDNDDR